MILKRWRRVVAAVLALFILLVSSPVSAVKIQQQKSILIVHSYNEGTSWTSEQNTGIISTLSKSNDNLDINVEYMDWKNYPTQENLDSFYNHLKIKYSDKKLDLVIATDDAAMTFVLEHRKVLFSDAPVVFSGINQEKVEELKKVYSNFTGVVEEIDPTETVRMALEINPNIKNVYLIYDNTESGISTGKIITKKINELFGELKVIPMNDLDFNSLLNTVSQLDNSSMLFFSTYYSDAEGSIINFNLAAREISRHSSIPMYHQYDFGLNNGAFGGNLLSGRLYGRYDADIAMPVLNGERADDKGIV